MLALRARLAPLLEARRNVVIGVTSCGPEEGVTTISRELSRVLATEDMEVLLCGPCGDLSTSSNHGCCSAAFALMRLLGW